MQMFLVNTVFFFPEQSQANPYQWTQQLIWASTHEHRAQGNWDTMVETTNGTSRRSAETRRQSCVNAFTQGIAHGAGSLSLSRWMSLVSLWLYSSCEFPTRRKRHDKFFPAFPQSEPFQMLPQAVCQPSNLSVSPTTLVLPECRTQVRLGVSPFNVSDFICNVSAGRKRTWKNRTCDGMLNIFTRKAIILLVYIPEICVCSQTM